MILPKLNNHHLDLIIITKLSFAVRFFIYTANPKYQ